MFYETPEHQGMRPRVFRRRQDDFEYAFADVYERDGEWTRWYYFAATLPHSVTKQIAMTQR